MEQLSESKVKILKQVWEDNSTDLAIKEGQITEQELAHYKEFIEEYGEELIVYLSVHGNARPSILPDLVEELKRHNCVVRYYVKGEPYNRLCVKNCDICIVVPECEGKRFILGKGTKGEAEQADKYEASVFFVSEHDPMYTIRGLIGTQDVEVEDGMKTDWLKTAYIADWGDPENIIDVIQREKDHLKDNGRRVNFASSKITKV